MTAFTQDAELRERLRKFIETCESAETTDPVQELTANEIVAFVQSELSRAGGERTKASHPGLPPVGTVVELTYQNVPHTGDCKTCEGEVIAHPCFDRFEARVLSGTNAGAFWSRSVDDRGSKRGGWEFIAKNDFQQDQSETASLRAEVATLRSQLAAYRAEVDSANRIADAAESMREKAESQIAAMESAWKASSKSWSYVIDYVSHRKDSRPGFHAGDEAIRIMEALDSELVELRAKLESVEAARAKVNEGAGPRFEEALRVLKEQNAKASESYMTELGIALEEELLRRATVILDLRAALAKAEEEAGELRGKLDVARLGFVNEAKARVKAEGELAKRDENFREVLELAVGRRETTIANLRGQMGMAGRFIEKLRVLLTDSNEDLIGMGAKACDLLDWYDGQLDLLDIETLDEVLAAMAEQCEVPNGPCGGCLQGAACDGMDTPDREPAADDDEALADLDRKRGAR